MCESLGKILAGKRLLIDELSLPSNEFHQLIENNHLRKIPAITQQKWRRQCNRCGNQNPARFGHIPCSRCDSTHVYCRNCLQTGRVLACESLYEWTGPVSDWPYQENPCAWEGQLTTHQQSAADKMQQVIDQKLKPLICWAVCGAGKTEMLFPAIELAIKKQKRICIATPRADVVRELYPRIKSAFPNTTIEALYADTAYRTDIGQIVISTTHQLIRYNQAFDVMIVDEIDAFPFHHDKTLTFLANRAAKQEAAHIYLTATPRAKQKRDIRRKLIDVVFVPRRFHGHPLIVPEEKLIIKLRQTLNDEKLPPFLIHYLQHRSNKRQLLVFVPTINRLATVAKAIEPFAQHLETVHADDTARKEKIDAFRNQSLDVLITTTILERGVTFPSIDVIILEADHDVFDEAAIVQIAGRAGRSPNDPEGDVILCHQGKTKAIVQAIKQIKTMNQKGF
ncbi:ComF operon protein 1 [Gracilibacillus halophilus YIM-C55.5]|uniref:ComF operon protein 1 n=1 Tax=Gracilibacillus halophilus YIM-C55.5 TaxID=1308866 RepID=N4WQI2_9BACI|nr:DNA/RNA helicase [Gracilibacillus halophilus]ENH98387.1 ComF operon protein 1 [Gracilibacillus halophilus YIM-C55.5]